MTDSNQRTNARFLLDTGVVSAVIGYDSLNDFGPHTQDLFDACLDEKDPLIKANLLYALGNSIGPALKRPAGNTSYEIVHGGERLIIDI